MLDSCFGRDFISCVCEAGIAALDIVLVAILRVFWRARLVFTLEFNRNFSVGSGKSVAGPWSSSIILSVDGLESLLIISITGGRGMIFPDSTSFEAHFLGACTVDADVDV